VLLCALFVLLCAVRTIRCCCARYSCCCAHYSLLLCALFAAAVHTIRCCCTRYSLLLYALFAAAVRTIRCCCAHYSMLLYALFAAAVRAIRCCCAHYSLLLCTLFVLLCTLFVLLCTLFVLLCALFAAAVHTIRAAVHAIRCCCAHYSLLLFTLYLCCCAQVRIEVTVSTGEGVASWCVLAEYRAKVLPVAERHGRTWESVLWARRSGPLGSLEPGVRPRRGGGGGFARARAVYKPPSPKKEGTPPASTASHSFSTTSSRAATLRTCLQEALRPFGDAILTMAKLALGLDLADQIALRRARLPPSRSGLLLRQRGGHGGGSLPARLAHVAVSFCLPLVPRSTETCCV
jgi:hypothetical protein